MKVKGHIRDLLAFSGLVSKRKKRISRSSARPVAPDPLYHLAHQLHPGKQHLVIKKIVHETPSARTYRCMSDPDAGPQPLAYFRAGQYISLKVRVRGTGITRPYTISSAPCEAPGPNGYYDITIKKEVDGFLTPYLMEHCKEGTQITASGPCGYFYYEPLRDQKQIVGVAGGAGITPFRSFAREIIYGQMDAHLLLFYGSREKDHILFYDELAELEKQAPDKFRVVHVLSCEETPPENCETGFITARIIKKYTDVANSSFFLCGPHAMYTFVQKELASLPIPSRRIRREVCGEVKDASILMGFPPDNRDKTFQIKVRMGYRITEIPAKGGETILAALERGNLSPPSQCRSGECGFCRSQLVSGKIFVNPLSDGRRAADKDTGAFHPCASYPLSDLEIHVPRYAKE